MPCICQMTRKSVNLSDWNSSKIVFAPEKAEYWLNGKKVLDFVPWSEDWNERRTSGKWDAYPDYGLAKTGKILPAGPWQQDLVQKH